MLKLRTSLPVVFAAHVDGTWIYSTPTTKRIALSHVADYAAQGTPALIIPAGTVHLFRTRSIGA